MKQMMIAAWQERNKTGIRLGITQEVSIRSLYFLSKIAITNAIVVENCGSSNAKNQGQINV
jgi:hypothetical protein